MIDSKEEKQLVLEMKSDLVVAQNMTISAASVFIYSIDDSLHLHKKQHGLQLVMLFVEQSPHQVQRLVDPNELPTPLTFCLHLDSSDCIHYVSHGDLA